jgi:hypothetical protein
MAYLRSKIKLIFIFPALFGVFISSLRAIGRGGRVYDREQHFNGF